MKQDTADRIAEALERIASSLERFEPDEAVCVHPADERKDYSVMGSIRWVCKVCGHRENMAGIDV